MLLSDRDIRMALVSGGLSISPLELGSIQPASVDLKLGNTLRVFNSTEVTCINPGVRQDNLTRLVELSDSSVFVVHPGEFLLGCTAETVTMPDNLAGRLEGVSSIGRLGLLVHSTAGFIDPGFSGRITLELSNVANLPIVLTPGMRIGQLCILRMSSRVAKPYGSDSLGSRYQGQDGPTASLAWVDNERQQA